MRTFFMLYVVPYEVLCHCERSVAISRKGTLLPAARCCLTAVICLRRDIVFDSDIAYAVIFALWASYG